MLLLKQSIYTFFCWQLPTQILRPTVHIFHPSDNDFNERVNLWILINRKRFKPVSKRILFFVCFISENVPD